LYDDRYTARLSQLTSPIRCDAVRQDLTDLETALQEGGGEGGLGVEGIAHQLLSGAHTHVDNIEDDIHKYGDIHSWRDINMRGVSSYHMLDLN
jgi:hypothetical protein